MVHHLVQGQWDPWVLGFGGCAGFLRCLLIYGADFSSSGSAVAHKRKRNKTHVSIFIFVFHHPALMVQAD